MLSATHSANLQSLRHLYAANCTATLETPASGPVDEVILQGTQPPQLGIQRPQNGTQPTIDSDLADRLNLGLGVVGAVSLAAVALLALVM